MLIYLNFFFEKQKSSAPEYTKVPSKDDILGITAIILTVSY